MTFCLGVKVQDGLVGIADTRVTSGTEVTTARKISIYRQDSYAMFLMTSGLRSVRDKALTYFDEVIAEQPAPFDRLFKAVNAFADQIRRAAQEDNESLEASGLAFDIHCLMGGQMRQDPEHKLYLLYPQGNWVEIGEETPYQIVGVTGHGKPILDRTLQQLDSLPFALKVGLLAFDSTRIAAANVAFPVDVVLFSRDARQMVEHRYEKEDLAELSNWWDSYLRRGVQELPTAFMDRLMAKLTPPVGFRRPAHPSI